MEKKKINVLFVSIAFPPKSDSEGLQVAKYFKYLARDENLNIDVVTSEDNTLFMPIDKHLEYHCQGYRQIIKIPFWENKYINYLIRNFNRDALNYPDFKFRFYKKWKNVLEKLKYKPNVIYSRSFPISSTLMAYKLQKKLKVPWVLHLSDPWTINPLYKLGEAQAWNDAIEYKCFSNATVLSFTSKKTIELYTCKYPQFSEKMILSPNVFDIEDKVEKVYHKNKKIKVIYTGGLVEKRSPIYLFKALKKLENENPEMIMDFEFLFAGTLDRINQNLFKNSSSSVKHLGLLSYHEALILQKEADILLVIDAPLNNHRDTMFFPSKLLDYMLGERRILALTDKESVTWNIVQQQKGDCIEYNDIEHIIKSLKVAWKAWIDGNMIYFENKHIDMNFCAEVNARKLSVLFKKISDEK